MNAYRLLLVRLTRVRFCRRHRVSSLGARYVWLFVLSASLLTQSAFAESAAVEPLHVFDSKINAIFANALDSGASLDQGNEVLLVEDGDDALLLRVLMIRRAQKNIAIQTFIWTNDETGRLMIYELIQAARRGVNVQVIADHFVSDKDSRIVAFLATVHPNFHMKHYRPAGNRIEASKLQSMLTSAISFRSVNQRMHNKIMIFDDRVAISGGRNIENSYFNRSLGMNFKDRDVLVIGPVVREVRKSFDHFWEYRHSKSSSDLLHVKKKSR